MLANPGNTFVRQIYIGNTGTLSTPTFAFSGVASHLGAGENITINAQGGLLGKRKIEVIKADEAAGTDANVKDDRLPPELVKKPRGNEYGDLPISKDDAELLRRRLAGRGPDPRRRRRHRGRGAPCGSSPRSVPARRG